MRRLYLLIAALILSGCAPSTPLLIPSTKPELDASLAKPCRELSKPQADYDAWLNWLLDDVLPAYGECASRHRKTVEAWPK